MSTIVTLPNPKSFFSLPSRVDSLFRSSFFFNLCFSFLCCSFYKMTKISRAHMSGP
ncbi:hypothetical protein BDM02DRAFT_3120053 [Thelephora ganbajun]|uniref:Uncharacterized protein n=1 Tax=Thelephora ganbajun TaxID=370292 RepID=A0ACB6Z7T8_THEGA|nr:hypothetical protein BDM02DRAFT_3120053 [Thelephora ganbajun]